MSDTYIKDLIGWAVIVMGMVFIFLFGLLAILVSVKNPITIESALVASGAITIMAAVVAAIVIKTIEVWTR